MRRRWLIWRGNPNSNLRLGQFALLGAAIFGALSGGDSSLLNVMSLLFVAATAWFEGSYANAVADFWPSQVRRGSVLRMGLGIGLSAGSWLLPGLIETSQTGLRDAFSGGALFGGLALICGASARFGMSDLSRYASRKLQDRLDDDF